MSNHKNVPLIEEYLLARGYSITRKRLGSSPHSLFTFIVSPEGKQLTLSTSALIMPFPTSAAKNIMDNKIRAYDFAQSMGVRIPDTLRISSDCEDKDLLAMLTKHNRLIVKPYNGFQSRGLTINIRDIGSLKQAIKESEIISEISLVQEQVDGEEVRLVTVDGLVKAALLRQKPQVIGDGVMSVAELIFDENRKRKDIISSLVEYPLLDAGLVPEDILNSTTVPAKGEVIKLNDKTMIRGGASIYDVIDKIDKSYIDLAESMTGWFGRGISCVDFMIKDFTCPASTDNYAFIEFNGAISIAMCYSCRDGKNFRLLDDYIGPMLIEAIG